MGPFRADVVQRHPSSPLLVSVDRGHVTESLLDETSSVQCLRSPLGLEASPSSIYNFDHVEMEL